MVKAAGRRLKVFQAQLGFYDSVVAAPSQAAALRAWGMHQNLFANGQARITDDPQAIKAALAHPEIPLKRAVGSNDPFGLEANLPKVPAGAKGTATSKPAPKPAPEPPPKPAADRSALDAAEAALKKVDDARKKEEARLDREQEKLDAKVAKAQSNYVSNRKAASGAVVEARKAYRDAGGTD